MRNAIIALVSGLFFLATPAAASNLEFSGTDQALMGLNGVVTSPADIAVGVVAGDERGDLPYVGFATTRVTGLFTGAFTTVYRFTFGLGDLFLAVLPVSHISPDPRFTVIPGAPAISEAPAGFPGSR